MSGPVSFPWWFRAAIGAMAAALLIPWWLLRSEGISDAFGRSGLEPLAGGVAPWIAVPPSAGLPPQAPSGRYFVNGMRVQYATYAAPRGADTMLRRFREGFERAGYEPREIRVEGQRTLVAIHPETKVMLTVRPERDRRGRERLRLTQQNLRELDPRFRPELPGVPVYPGARGAVLVAPTREAQEGTLAYAIDESPESAARFYLREMPRRGWERLEAPAGAGGNGPFFFRRSGRECSVLILRRRSGSGSAVFVALTDPRRGAP